MANRQERRAADNAPKTVPRAVHERVLRSLAVLTVQQSDLDRSFAAQAAKQRELQRERDELRKALESYRSMSTKERLRAAYRVLRTGSIS